MVIIPEIYPGYSKNRSGFDKNILIIYEINLVMKKK